MRDADRREHGLAVVMSPRTEHGLAGRGRQQTPGGNGAMPAVEQAKSAYAKPSPRPESGEVLGDFAYRVLREAIRRGRFQPGEHLREVEVAHWLDISRTPVREAFHRIASEGLLTTGPWNGLMVSEVDGQQLIELYTIREVLEGTAAALAASNASEAEIDHLFAIVRAENAGEDNPATTVEVNSFLHPAIHAAAHNRYLIKSLETVADAIGLLHHLAFAVPGLGKAVRREHMRILEAIRGRNPKRAEQAARRHVRQSLVRRLALQQGDAPKP
jgi:DNA-binding GntR family transcriptional regulator